MIPISSKTLKFRRIYEKKLEHSNCCDTVAFGNVLGCKKAFLIQNMCPVTNEYISNEYLSNNVPVLLEDNFKRELISKAEKILALVRQGKSNLVFHDILKIEKELLAKMNN